LGLREGSTAGSGNGGKDLSTGGSTTVQGVATDGSYAYWVSNGQVRKSDPLRPGSPAYLCFDKDMPRDLGPDPDIAVDDQWVFVSSPNLIWRCPKN